MNYLCESLETDVENSFIFTQTPVFSFLDNNNSAHSNLLQPVTKLGQSNVFTGICDSVNRGCLLPGSKHTLLSRHPPRSRHPLGADTPQGTPPRVEHAGRYGQCVGGMHPTGMQSCFLGCHSFRKITKH